MYSPVMTSAELEALIDEIFPQVHRDGKVMSIEAIEPGSAVLAFETNDAHVRPGGTVSGPSIMALVDYAAYAVILGHLGPVALAVTTSLNINFLRKPVPGRLIATCKLLKLGKRLVVCECSVTQEKREEQVAHATATYSIPPAS